jgi:hypothetical protein
VKPFDVRALIGPHNIPLRYWLVVGLGHWVLVGLLLAGNDAVSYIGLTLIVSVQVGRTQKQCRSMPYCSSDGVRN